VGKLIGVSPVWAGTATSSLSISAIIPPLVNVDTTPLNNINYDSSTGSDVQSQIVVTASVGSTITITIDQGSNPGNNSNDINPIRRMSDGQGNFLNYVLTKDASHTEDWGNNSQTGVILSGTGSQQTITYYLRILPNQNTQAGNYTDTLQMTTSY
jgi:spore coat protein U-like protein